MKTGVMYIQIKNALSISLCFFIVQNPFSKPSAKYTSGKNDETGESRSHA
jgi:hypothetical protein